MNRIYFIICLIIIFIILQFFPKGLQVERFSNKKSKEFIINVGNHSSVICREYADIIIPFLKPILAVDTKIIVDNKKHPNLAILTYWCHKNKEIDYSKVKNIFTICRESEPVPENISNLRFNTFAPELEKDIWFPWLLKYLDNEKLDKLWFKKFKPMTERKNLLLYVNSNCVKHRDSFFEKFQKMSKNQGKSLGRCLNTHPYPNQVDKHQDNGTFFEDYKFIIAMENKYKKGYLTEKILNAYLNGAIPIYWGCSDSVSKFFNKDTYIDLRDFASPEDCIKYILDLSQDKEKMLHIQKKNIFKNGKIPEMFKFYDSSSVYNQEVREKIKILLVKSKDI